MIDRLPRSFAIPGVKAEELIYFYIDIRGQWSRTHGAVKITYNLEKKSKELGINLRQAFCYVDEARRLGILDEALRLGLIDF